jgi:hypothetical protein
MGKYWGSPSLPPVLLTVFDTNLKDIFPYSTKCKLGGNCKCHRKDSNSKALLEVSGFTWVCFLVHEIDILSRLLLA